MKKGNIFLLGTLLLSTFTFFSCKGNNSSTSSSSSSISENLNNPKYSIKITSLSGKPLEGVSVEVYEGTTFIREVATDETGVASMRLEDKNYSIELSDIPNGYFLEKDINLVKGTYEYEFKLSSRVIDEEAPSGTIYQIGDLVYDFSLTTSDGEEFTLSEAVNDYDAVMINFWYRTCSWCVKEFPFMEEAYQEYKNEIGYIALSHQDSNVAIENFKLDIAVITTVFKNINDTMVSVG